MQDRQDSPPSAPPGPASPLLVLGSGSIYRRELLSRLHLPFVVRSPEVDETPQAGETPLALAGRLALHKAQAVSKACLAEGLDAVVIGSDQVADLGGQCLGKPGSHERAVEQLSAMSGQTVRFHSAVAVLHAASGLQSEFVNTVDVRFRDLDPGTIETYLRLEQPYDCAGSAKAEGLGIALLASIHSSDPTALIGLPLIELAQVLRLVGLDPLGTPPTPGADTVA